MPNAHGKLKKLETAFKEVYLMNDPYIIRLLMALYLSHLMKSDPVWVVVVAASSTGKSELCNALSTAQYVHPLSTLTANTFISGAKLNGGAPASYLHKLSAGTPMEGNGIIIFKDLTSLLSEAEITRTSIMGQLREIYDGKYTKQFGTGHSVNWVGKVTVIAASTHSIYRLRQQYASMGERLLLYELITPDRKEAARRSLENQESGQIAEKRAQLAEMSRIYLNEILEIPAELPNLTEELKKDLTDLAEMSTKARSDVMRNYRSPQQEIIGVFPAEYPARMIAALQTLAKALMVINHNEAGNMSLTAEDNKLLFKITLDSMPFDRRDMMVALTKYKTLETAGLAIQMDMPTQTIRRRVEDLVALGIAIRERGSGSKGDRWQLKPEYKKIMNKFAGVEITDQELTEKDELMAEIDDIRETLPKEEKSTQDNFSLDI